MLSEFGDNNPCWKELKHVFQSHLIFMWCRHCKSNPPDQPGFLMYWLQVLRKSRSQTLSIVIRISWKRLSSQPTYAILEVVYLTNWYLTFCLTCYLYDVHFQGKLQYVGHVGEQKIKCGSMRTREITDIRLLHGLIHIFKIWTTNFYNF